MLAFGAAGREQDAPVGEGRTDAMRGRPAAPDRHPAKAVRNLETFFFEQDVLVVADREPLDEGSALRPADEDHRDDDEHHDDDGEDDARHSRIVCRGNVPACRPTGRSRPTA